MGTKKRCTHFLPLLDGGSQRGPQTHIFEPSWWIFPSSTHNPKDKCILKDLTRTKCKDQAESYEILSNDGIIKFRDRPNTMKSFITFLAGERPLPAIIISDSADPVLIRHCLPLYERFPWSCRWCLLMSMRIQFTACSPGPSQTLITRRRWITWFSFNTEIYSTVTVHAELKILVFHRVQVLWKNFMIKPSI